MKITLATIQVEQAWHELQTTGFLIAREEFVDPDFKAGYDWMKIQMTKRIGSPREKDQYPIWAWYQYGDEKRKRPDLRRSGHLPPGTIGYRLEIEKEAGEVLLSDFELWHTPLSYKSMIGNSEKEGLEFDAAMEKEFGNWSFEELPEKVRRRIEKSWEKIFDMDFDIAHYARPFKEKQIQATFWELKIEEVIKVDRFVAR